MKRIAERKTNYDFGKYLSEILEEKDMTQRMLSHSTGYSESYISKILNQSKTPDLVTLEVLCNALDIDLSIFLLKSIMEERGANARNDAFIEKHILPTLLELDKIIYRKSSLDELQPA